MLEGHQLSGCPHHLALKLWQIAKNEEQNPCQPETPTSEHPRQAPKTDPKSFNLLPIIPKIKAEDPPPVPPPLLRRLLSLPQVSRSLPAAICKRSVSDKLHPCYNLILALATIIFLLFHAQTAPAFRVTTDQWPAALPRATGGRAGP